MEDSKGSKPQDAKREVSEQKPIEVKVSKPIISIAFSPDSQYIVTASRGEPTIRIWDQSGKPIRTIELPPDRNNSELPNSVRKVAVSPNGKFIASSNSNGLIQLWDFESGKLLDSYSAHTCSQGIAIAPDNDSIISTSLFDNYDILIRSRTTKQTRHLKGHTGAVSDVTISQNGEFIVSCSTEDGTVRVWDFTTGELFKMFDTRDMLVKIATSLTNWEKEKKKDLDSKPVSDGRNQKLYSAICSSDGSKDRLICSLREEYNIYRMASRLGSKMQNPINTKEERYLLENTLGESAEFGNVVISSDTQIIGSNINGRILRGDLSNDKSLTLIANDHSLTNPVTITPDNQHLVSVSDKRIKVWGTTPESDRIEIETVSSIFGSFFGPKYSTYTRETYKPLFYIISPTPIDLCYSIAISPDERQIIISHNKKIDSNRDTSYENKLAIFKFPPELLAQQIVKIFRGVLQKPESLNITLVRRIFNKVSHVDEFRFAYTLLSLQLQQNPVSARDLHDDAYKCLERLAETCVVGPSRDSKQSSKQGASYIARYKLILDTMCHDQIITKQEQYTLDNIAERNMVFSDHRFKELESQISILKQEIELQFEAQRENIELIARDLNQLKKALKTKADREFYFAIAKVATMFLANGIVDLAASALNMSDIAKMGATVLKIEVKEWKELVKKGAEAVKENLTASGAELALKKAGFDPDALVDIWVSSTVHLQTTPLSSSVSSSVTISSSLSHSDSTLESSSSTTTTSPQQPESKQPGNIAQSFATVKSPIMSQPAVLERRLSESDLYPLHSAIKKNSTAETIGDLLDVDENINGKNADGETPLTLATKQDNLEIVTLLVNRKANINDGNTTGKSPVKIAAEQGNLDMVKFLLGKGAEGNKLYLLKQARENQPAPVVQAGLS